ncbi:MAG: hypothetical protein HEEMFOPI_01931 [Holosporales bacterium]
MLKKIVFLCLVFLCFHIQGSDFRYSCIQILPFDASSETDCSKSSECKCIESTVYSDNHGNEQIFRVVDQQESSEEHIDILKKVVDYKKINFTGKEDQRNIMFARISCNFELDGKDLIGDFYLGIFVSGKDDYYPKSGVAPLNCFPIVNFCPQGVPENVKYTHRGTQALGMVYNLSAEKAASSISQSFCMIGQDIKQQKISSKRNFDFEELKFSLISGDKLLDEHGVFIRKRLSTLKEAMKMKEPTDTITTVLFKRKRYEEHEGRDPCFVLKNLDNQDYRCGLGYCFFDSEQVFLSFLESDSPDCKTNMSIEGVQYKLNSMKLFLYNYRDMCRFCRGTLSHLLNNKKLSILLMRILEDLFNKKNAKILSDSYSLEVYAFGHEKTDKQ